MRNKLTPEEKERQRQADLERLKRQTLENNPSMPRPARPSVALFSPRLVPPGDGPLGNGPHNGGLPEAPSAAQERETAPPAAVMSAGAPPRAVNDPGAFLKPNPEPGSAPAVATENGPAEPPEAPLARENALPRAAAIPEKPVERARASDALLERMKGFQRPAGATRNNVRVTEQAFSTVTGYAVTHNLDKIVVVSSLLEAYLPKDPAKTAEYLLREPRKGVRNRDLTYVEYPALTERFNEVCATHGLPRAVIVENLILHQPPAVAKIYPPRRQFRRRGA